jgi:hypothetical protein
MGGQLEVSMMREFDRNVRLHDLVRQRFPAQGSGSTKHFVLQMKGVSELGEGDEGAAIVAMLIGDNGEATGTLQDAASDGKL